MNSVLFENSERQVLFRAQILDAEIVRIEGGAEIAPEVKALPSERRGTTTGCTGLIGVRSVALARLGASSKALAKPKVVSIPAACRIAVSLEGRIVRRDRPWPHHLA